MQLSIKGTQANLSAKNKGKQHKSWFYLIQKHTNHITLAK